MRIDAINRVYETYKQQSVAPTQKVGRKDLKDQVALSETAKDFQNIYKMLAEVPDIRQDKVQAIKEQMQSGTYDVNAKEVAEKLVSQFNIKG